MRITADTNLLVRVMTGDDERQSKLAQAELLSAEAIAVPLPALCELVWVLARGYGIALPEIATAIAQLANADTVVVDRPAVDAGLAMMAAGGDFADAIIAHEGEALGAEGFVSFDQIAVERLQSLGKRARLLG